VPAGTRIAVRGETCNQFVIVAAGRLRACSTDDGRRSLVPGDTAGWAAMWEMTANEATVVAETEARILVMGHAQFRAVKAIVKRPATVLADHRLFRAPMSAGNAHESMTASARGAR
jgi:CRP-like cAMP-binding protein